MLVKLTTGLLSQRSSVKAIKLKEKLTKIFSLNKTSLFNPTGKGHYVIVPNVTIPNVTIPNVTIPNVTIPNVTIPKLVKIPNINRNPAIPPTKLGEG